LITLVSGGARSGKSSFAEKYAWSKKRDDVIYLATSVIIDKEMEERVRRHRVDRPKSWETVEEAYQLSEVFSQLEDNSFVLIDCITVYISNLILEYDKEKNLDEAESEILLEIKKIINIARDKNIDLLIVTNELGQGLVPEYKLGRVYRDIVGRVNQLIASNANEVYLTVAGLPVELKELGMKNLARYNKE